MFFGILHRKALCACREQNRYWERHVNFSAVLWMHGLFQKLTTSNSSIPLASKRKTGLVFFFERCCFF